MRYWLAMLITAFLIGDAQAKPMWRYAEFERAIICVELDHAKELLEAYKKSQEEGDTLLDLYEDGRCERADVEGYVVANLHSETWTNPDDNEPVTLNIYCVDLIDTDPYIIGYVVAEKSLKK